jgi:hypothetical protein
LTEAEWLACDDPAKMVDHLLVDHLGPKRNPFRPVPDRPLAQTSEHLPLSSRASRRTLRLFAVACCRGIWQFLDAGASREAVELAEQIADQPFADQRARPRRDELYRARNGARAAANRATGGRRDARYAAARALGVSLSMVDAGMVSFCAIRAAGRLTPERPGGAEAAGRLRQAGYLRCIFGPLPFRAAPVIDSSWLAWGGGTVPRLAEGVYEGRSLPAGTFDAARLTVLADALEDAGCNDSELLGHLRSGGIHVRGCWALDLVLGKG